MVKTSTCGEKVSVFHKYIKQHKQFYLNSKSEY